MDATLNPALPLEGIDPRQPTTHPPGSPLKVEVLRQRAALRLPLFHALDNPGEWRASGQRQRGGHHAGGLLHDPEARALLEEALAGRLPLYRLARRLGVSRATAWALRRQLRQQLKAQDGRGR